MSKLDRKLRKAGEAAQTAAFPIRWDADGRLRILMVTSRDTGRWVMPKGWLMNGRLDWHAAEIEALEEAGAIGQIADEVLGHYTYDKRLSGGKKVRCRVSVYPMLVESLKKDWKERRERKRHWFSPKKAAKLVNEPELAELILSLKDKPKKHPVIQELLRSA